MARSCYVLFVAAVFDMYAGALCACWAVWRAVTARAAAALSPVARSQWGGGAESGGRRWAPARDARADSPSYQEAVATAGLDERVPPGDRVKSGVRAVAIALARWFTLSGLAALSHELCWQRGSRRFSAFFLFSSVICSNGAQRAAHSEPRCYRNTGAEILELEGVCVSVRERAIECVCVVFFRGRGYKLSLMFPLWQLAAW